MSGDVSDRKRLVVVKASNLRNNHLYIGDHHGVFL
jgi:hypothetical protein